jgi:hypothetical protein
VHAEAAGVSGTWNKELERETSFIFIPSWWLMKLGLGYGFKFDLNAMSSHGWQLNIKSFDVSWLYCERRFRPILLRHCR